MTSSSFITHIFLICSPLQLPSFCSATYFFSQSFCLFFLLAYFWVESTYISMKFGKRLKKQILESLPEWRDKFLSYKDMKKLVRLISAAPPSPDGVREYGKAETEFVYLLNNEIHKFNNFFMEQEEDFVIRLEVYIFNLNMMLSFLYSFRQVLQFFLNYCHLTINSH